MQWVRKKKLVAKALDGDLGVIDETRDNESRCVLRIVQSNLADIREKPTLQGFKANSPGLCSDRPLITPEKNPKLSQVEKCP